MAKGMTTDVYPRDNCIAPDIAFIVWTTFKKHVSYIVWAMPTADGNTGTLVHNVENTRYCIKV